MKHFVVYRDESLIVKKIKEVSSFEDAETMVCEALDTWNGEVVHGMARSYEDLVAIYSEYKPASESNVNLMSCSVGM